MQRKHGTPRQMAGRSVFFVSGGSCLPNGEFLYCEKSGDPAAVIRHRGIKRSKAHGSHHPGVTPKLAPLDMISPRGRGDRMKKESLRGFFTRRLRGLMWIFVYRDLQ
ncbi:MAG: hypothetical protein ACK2UB_07205 [Anaerolineales bacterium]|jgi:hypothetical protein